MPDAGAVSDVRTPPPHPCPLLCLQVARLPLALPGSSGVQGQPRRPLSSVSPRYSFWRSLWPNTKLCLGQGNEPVSHLTWTVLPSILSTHGYERPSILSTFVIRASKILEVLPVNTLFPKHCSALPFERVCKFHFSRRLRQF